MDAMTGTFARAEDRGLQVAHVSWLALVIGTVLLGLLAMPAEWHRLETVCRVTGDTPSCPEPHLTPHALAQLHHLGLSLADFAAFWLLVTILLAALFLSLGTYIVRRRSDEPIALLAGMFLVTFGVSISLDISDTGAVPLLIWAIQVLKAIAAFSLILFLYLFPNGRFAPRWIRWIAIPAACEQAVSAFLPADMASNRVIAGASVIAAVIMAASILFSQVYRYLFASGPTERQQVRWVMLAIAVAIVFFVSVSVSQTNSASGMHDLSSIVINSLIYYAVASLIPLSLGIAILRYQLWEIDLILNRTLVYGSLTAIVVALYILVVGGLGKLLQAQGNLLLSLLGAGLVAVLFQPLRVRLQRVVNRLMYGERDDPYQVIGRLGRRLEGTLSPDTTLPAIAETVGQALKLPWVTISLRGGMTAAWGERDGQASILPLLSGGEMVGEMVLGLRRGEGRFAEADRRLVEHLARQAGIAAHAVLLTADLRRSRERLVTAREEERRRLRRDLHDGLGPSLATLTLKLDAARNLLRRDPEAADDLLLALKRQVQDNILDIRRLVYSLRPPSLDELGLASAIEEQARHYQAGGLAVSVEASMLPVLPAAVEVAAYRIVQEALTNVVRHAQASTARVRLKYAAGELTIEVSDDGIGLPADCASGIGITSMRERTEELGGSCTIMADPAGGTRVHAVLPCGDVA